MLIWASWGSEWNLFHLFICIVPRIIFFLLYSLKCWVNDQFSFTVCKMILQRALCLSGTCQEVELHSGGQLHKLSWKNYLLKTKGTSKGSWGILYRQDPWVKRGKCLIAMHGAQWELDSLEEGQTDRAVTGTAAGKRRKGSEYPSVPCCPRISCWAAHWLNPTGIHNDGDIHVGGQMENSQHGRNISGCVSVHSGCYHRMP